MRRYKPAKNYLESLPLRMKAFEVCLKLHACIVTHAQGAYVMQLHA